MKLGFGSNVCRAIVRSAAGVIIEERVQHNMVLNQGRSNIRNYGFFGSGSITHACAVGSSSQSITAGTTQLNDEEARVVCGSRSLALNPARETMVANFSSGQVAGKTLHTWGFSHSTSSGSNINTAGVFEDGGGNPSPITVPAGASLTLEYEFEMKGSFSGKNNIALSGYGTVAVEWEFEWEFITNGEAYLQHFSNVVSGASAPRVGFVFEDPVAASRTLDTYGVTISPGPITVDWTDTQSSPGTLFAIWSTDPPVTIMHIRLDGSSFSHQSGDVISLGDLKFSW